MLEQHLNTTQVWSNFVFSYLCVSVDPMSRVAHSPTSASAHSPPVSCKFYVYKIFRRLLPQIRSWKTRGLPKNRFKERKNENYIFQLVYCAVVDDADRLFKTVVTCFNDEKALERVRYSIQKHPLLVRSKWNTMNLSIFYTSTPLEGKTTSFIKSKFISLLWYLSP